MEDNSDSRTTINRIDIDNLLENFDRFIRGYESISPYDKLDPVSAAIMIFGSLQKDDPLITKLGEKITEWINACIEMEISTNSKKECATLIREFNDVFEIITLFNLKNAINWMEKNYGRIDEFLKKMENLDKPSFFSKHG